MRYIPAPRLAQRGSLLIYGALGAGAVILALGLAVKLQSARIGALQQENAALTERVAQWTAAAKACSDATEAARKQAEDRARAALAALQRVRAASIAAGREADRLRALLGQKPATGCPAAEGVAAVREGLK